MRMRVRCFFAFLGVFTASFLNAQEAWLGPPPTAPTAVLPPASLPLGEPRLSNAMSGFYDTTSREGVRALFNSTWVRSRTATIGWTGNAAACSEGTISQEWKDSVVTGLNFLRNLAGVPGAVSLDSSNNAKAQKAALMISVNKQLSHAPPASWACYSADGATAAGSSNICLSSGNLNPGCLELYMDDFGSNNTAVGHRRWILYPQTQAFGDGDVPANGLNSSGNDLWVFDSHYGGPRPATRDPYVAWPSPGYFPYQLVPNRWSFSYAGANFSGVSVALTKDGVAIPLTIETVQNGFGENTIVFFPTGADITRPTAPSKPAADITYTVTISNVNISGTPQNITYSVTVFDPAVESTVPSTGCTYGLSSGGQAFGAAGGSGNVSIATGPGCVWTLSDIPNWISLAGSFSGVANGMVSYQVAANSGASRTATMTITNASFTVEQQAASIPGLSFIGSMPHIAAQGDWNTMFTFVNKSSSPVQSRLGLLGNNGSQLSLPLLFPQQASAAGPLLAASLDRTLAANASLVIQTAGPNTPPVTEGSAQFNATGAVDGFAVFSFLPTKQEAVVPLETRNASSYLLPFDNTNNVVLGVALENVSALAANVQVVIRDDAGVQTETGAIALQGGAHSSFVLSGQFLSTADKRGTIEFLTPPGGRISALGVRFTPPGILTTIPVLANGAAAGGSISHIASGQGWKTTFVLVNAGASSAQAHLKFFANNGTPLSLPLSFPQSGGGTSAVASALDRTLAAGATLAIESTGLDTDPLLTGSAQLTTDGGISGFVIFRYTNGEEAVVPLENRTANAYLLAFDNTPESSPGSR